MLGEGVLNEADVERQVRLLGLLEPQHAQLARLQDLGHHVEVGEVEQHLEQRRARHAASAARRAGSAGAASSPAPPRRSGRTSSRQVPGASWKRSGSVLRNRPRVSSAPAFSGRPWVTTPVRTSSVAARVASTLRWAARQTALSGTPARAARRFKPSEISTASGGATDSTRGPVQPSGGGPARQIEELGLREPPLPVGARRFALEPSRAPAPRSRDMGSAAAAGPAGALRRAGPSRARTSRAAVECRLQPSRIAWFSVSVSWNASSRRRWTVIRSCGAALEVEVPPLLALDENVDHRFLLRLREMAEVLDRDRQRGLPVDELQRLGEAGEVERGAQDRMARDDPVDRRLEARGVEPRAGQVEAVDVVVGGVGGHPVHLVQHAGLQTRQRIGVLELAGGIAAVRRRRSSPASSSNGSVTAPGGPIPGATSRLSSPRARASASIVGCWKISWIVSSMPRSRARAITWMLRIESPPSAKKLSLTPTCVEAQRLRPDRRELALARAPRRHVLLPEVAAGSPPARAEPCGRPCRCAVSGSRGRKTKAAGTM